MEIGCFRLIRWRRWLFSEFFLTLRLCCGLIADFWIVTEREHIVLGVRRSDWRPGLVWSSCIEKGRFC